MWRKLAERSWALQGRKVVYERLASLEAEVANLRYEVAGQMQSGVAIPKLPQIATKEDTLAKLLSERVSICRFGDGELKIACGKSITYQEHCRELELRLKEILVSDDPEVLVGLPNLFGSLEGLRPRHQRFWRRYLGEERERIYKLLSFEKLYYDTQFSRPYIIYADGQAGGDYFQGVRELWRGEHVVLVEGKQSRVGVGNDLLSTASSVQRIICPPKNAFAKYAEIMRQAAALAGPKLFLLALGPAATVLAYDLAKAGYRSLDIGHIDLEYEWFLRNAKEKVVVPGKCLAETGYVNDFGSGTECEEYLSQIIAVVP